VSVAVRTRVYESLKNLIDHEDDQVRTSAASILGIISEVRTNKFADAFPPFLPIYCDANLTCYYGSTLRMVSWQTCFRSFWIQLCLPAGLPDMVQHSLSHPCFGTALQGFVHHLTCHR